MSDHMTQPLSELADAIIADGIVDAEEVKKIRERIYADGVIDREEADFMFNVNDAVSGNENDPSWQELFVDALTSHVLEDEISPDVLDDDEAKYLISKIQADEKVDDIELALMVNIVSKAKSAPESFNEFVLSSMKTAILEDGIIDAQEVETIRKVIYGSGGSGGEAVSRLEADFLFDLNDAVSGNDNDPSWQELFVEALTSHVLEDEISPDVLDDDEAKYLISKIQADEKVDDIELALMVNIVSKAKSAPESFNEFVLSSMKTAILEDGIIDAQEVEMLRKVIYGSGGSGGEAVSRLEADFIFDLNDATTGNDNHQSWKELFVETLTSHLLEDEESPGEVDADESGWLIDRIEGDDKYDENERALLSSLKSKAKSIDEKLKFKMDLVGI